MRFPRTITLTVENGQTTSEAFRVGRRAIGAVRTPATLTSTTITFTSSGTEAGTYLPVYADGDQVSLSVSTSRHVALAGAEADAFSSVDWAKLVCGSAEGGERTIEVVLK